MKVKELLESNDIVDLTGSVFDDPFDDDFRCSKLVKFGRTFNSLKGSPSEVLGIFNCGANDLHNLVGGPSEVGSDYICNDNRLTSLEGSPTHIHGDFNCSTNNLTELKNGPEITDHSFYCHNNNLDSLEGGPHKVGGDYSCYKNKLTTLEGAPKYIRGVFLCYQNKLTSLDHVPMYIDLDLDLDFNEIESLKGIHKKIKKIGRKLSCDVNPIQDGFIDILKIERAPAKFDCSYPEITRIINKHLMNPDIKERVIDAMSDFIDNDLEEHI